jgi:hypothetical protein
MEANPPVLYGQIFLLGKYRVVVRAIEKASGEQVRNGDDVHV